MGIYVGSFINWGKPFEDVSESNFDPSVILISLEHQEDDLVLKSPVIIDKDCSHQNCFLKRNSKLGTVH